MARTVRRPSTRHAEEEVSRAGEAAAEAVVMALLTDPGHPSMHTAVIPGVFTPGESFTIVCCLSYSMYLKV